MPGWFWPALVGGVVFLAVLPTLIALIRRAEDIEIIMLFNALGCATVLGWPIALVMAIKWPRRESRVRYVPNPQLPPGLGGDPSSRPGGWQR
jgi:hypothetical protein